MSTLKEKFRLIGLDITDQQEEMLNHYMRLVLDNNNKVNLTAIKDEEEFHVKHYVDSAVIWDLDEYKQAQKIIDVGTGGGFPGVPLAILNPEKEFTLMDSLNKRMKMVDQMCKEVGIKNVKVVHSRAEDLGKDPDYRQQFDVCVSRAVANLAVLSEYCIPFVKKGGAFISYKSGESEEEINDSKKAIKVLGGHIRKVETMEIDGQGRSIVIIEKKDDTPKKYPRQAGKPSKSPIR